MSNIRTALRQAVAGTDLDGMHPSGFAMLGGDLPQLPQDGVESVDHGRSGLGPGYRFALDR